MDISDLYPLFLKSQGVFTDTRKPIPGGIYFALKGENFNGNLFAKQALEDGAAYAVVDEVKGSEDERILLVEDVLTIMQRLSRYHRDQLDIPFIGITGSNGKTTSKELIRDVLAQKFKVFATHGNLNNHIGVPLSLLSINTTHELAIIEMGANHVGEIEFLSSLSDPDYGLITNIGTAHIGEFGGQENIIKGKTELYKHIQKKDGHLFVDSDSDILMEKSEGISRTTFGTQGEIQVSMIASDPFLEVAHDGMHIQTELIGDYNLTNAGAAISIGLHFGIIPEQIKHALEGYRPGNNRSQLERIGSVRVIMDAYNANPSSMTAALENFGKMSAGKRYFILGDMFELGEDAERYHDEIMALALKSADSGLFIGPSFHAVAKNHPNAVCFADTEAASSHLRSHPIQEGLLLLKGSRAMAVEGVLDALRSVLEDGA